MRGKNKKEELLEATMQIISEKGLSGFSMKQVTNRVGVSEALLYKHFDTKENLLYQAYLSVDEQIATMLEEMETPVVTDPMSALQGVKALWMGYYKLLVELDYRTLFYFEYRDSSYKKESVLDKVHENQSSFSKFIKIFRTLDSAFHIYDKVDADHLWTYILDVTGIFAKRVIRGELENNQDSAETTWSLMSGGLVGIAMGGMFPSMSRVSA